MTRQQARINRTMALTPEENAQVDFCQAHGETVIGIFRLGLFNTLEEMKARGVPYDQTAADSKG